jgi:hypothetical protein
VIRAGAALLLALVARPLAAEDASAPPAPPDAALVRRSAAWRAALPVPEEPWRFEAPLLLDGARVGAVRVVAEPTSVAGRPAWRVLERTLREAGRGRVLTETLCELAPDLTLLAGECLVDAPTGRHRTHFARRAGRLVCRSDAGRGEVELSLAASATVGLFAAARLAAALPAEPGATAWLPAFDPRFAFGDEDGAAVPPDLADLVLVAEGPRVRASTRYGRHVTLHMDPARRTLLAVQGGLPRLDMVPGAEAAPPTWFERVGEPAAGPLEAFVAFGRGYHTADRALLEGAIHWPSLREQEVEAGSYPADVPLERVREDWIAEFVSQSKRRTLADADDLLLQLLCASPLTRRDDGSVHLATPAAFGGHGYLLALRDGRWHIVAID